MIQLGVSLYPEQETAQQIRDYLKLAKQYGFKKVFTSLFSVEGSNEDIIKYFKDLCDVAHEFDMEVYGDCNARFFMQMGATPEDLSIFKEMGLDVLRLDLMFNDERDVAIVNNDQGLGVQLNASLIPAVKRVIESGGDKNRIIGSYNFYPLRNTGAGSEDVYEVNKFFKSEGMKTQIFISSNVEGAHGPWPISDGLPTIEEDRDLPIGLQLRHVYALGCQEVIIGNAFASKEELEELADTVNEIYVTAEDKPFYFPGLRNEIPIGDIERIPLTIEPAEDLSDTEKELLYDFKGHNVSEYTHIIIRSRWGRMDFRYAPIPQRPCDKKYFEDGDVVILNEKVGRYKGEVHIVRKPLINDGSMNYAGKIAKEEMFLLDYLKYRTNIGFIAKK
ncbi:MAG: DUF871 domain-containing protein [Erysipelotrichaceae bacterium]|nr:DUF871 domain-containing protein [Erysipelotrichaceae bacterium]